MKNKRSISFMSSKITSIISITLVLVFLGIVMLFLYLGNGLSNIVKEQISFNIVLSSNTNSQDVQKILNGIQSQNFVKSATFISKEDAKNQLIKELGDDPEEILGYNPAQDCIEVFLKKEYANSDSIPIIKQKLTYDSNVTDILYEQESINMVSKNITKIMTILLIISSFLILISFTLINNTIRIAIYSKRFIIYSMKLVGATNSFIRRPFVIDNIFIGLISGILADFIIFFIIRYVEKDYSSIINNILSLKDTIFIFFIVIIVGFVISLLATFFSVNKYLKMNYNNLYNV